MSSSESNIKAEIRSEFGKGAARRIRRDHKIPAVVYGHGNEPVHLTLPGHQTMMALKHLGARVGLLDADIYGPSIPLMMDVSRRPHAGPDGKVVPLTSYGIRLMSLGFLMDERGGLAEKVREQRYQAAVVGELRALAPRVARVLVSGVQPRCSCFHARLLWL